MRGPATPYLMFDGNAKQALDFYKEVFQGEVSNLQTYGEADYPTPPEANDRIIHAQFNSGDFTLMFSDSFPGNKTQIGSNISLTLDLESEEEIQRLYDALRENGSVYMELQDTFWGALYAKVQDQFGIIWDLNHQK